MVTLFAFVLVLYWTGRRQSRKCSQTGFSPSSAQLAGCEDTRFTAISIYSVFKVTSFPVLYTSPYKLKFFFFQFLLPTLNNSQKNSINKYHKMTRFVSILGLSLVQVSLSITSNDMNLWNFWALGVVHTGYKNAGHAKRICWY